MALDFPSSPTNGQSYAGYVYDSSLPGWRNINSDSGVQSLNTMGLKNVVPTSVTVGSGTATISSNGTVTFSGATSISIDGAFNSTYTNYRVVGYNLTGSAATDLNARFRASGATITNNVYYTGATLVRADAVSSNYSGFNGIGYSSIAPVTVEVGWTGIVWDIYQPFVSSTQTTSNFQSTGYQTAIQSRNGCIMFNQTQTVDGFNLFPNTASNLGGKINIYGYTN